MKGGEGSGTANDAMVVTDPTKLAEVVRRRDEEKRLRKLQIAVNYELSQLRDEEIAARRGEARKP